MGDAKVTLWNKFFGIFGRYLPLKEKDRDRLLDNTRLELEAQALRDDHERNKRYLDAVAEKQCEFIRNSDPQLFSLSSGNVANPTPLALVSGDGVEQAPLALPGTPSLEESSSPVDLAYTKRAVVNSMLADVDKQYAKDELLLSVLKEAQKEPELSVSPEPPSQQIVNAVLEGIPNTAEDMRQYWARLLLGEVKKPGHFSIGTLDVLRRLTKQNVEDAEYVSQYLFQMCISDKAEVTTPVGTRRLLSRLISLNHAGLVSEPSGTFGPAIAPGDVWSLYHQTGNYVEIKNVSRLSILFPSATLSPAFVELLPIMGNKALDADFISRVIAELRSLGCEVTFPEGVNDDKRVFDKAKDPSLFLRI